MSENDAIGWDEAFPQTGSRQGRNNPPEDIGLHIREALVVNAAGAKFLDWLQRMTIEAPMPEKPPVGWTPGDMALWHEARCNLVRDIKRMIRLAEENRHG